MWGCVQFLLTWQDMKYHLTQESAVTLFLTDHHSILPYYHLRFTYYLYPFASHELFSLLLPIKTVQFRFLPVKQQGDIQPQGLH